MPDDQMPPEPAPPWVRPQPTPQFIPAPSPPVADGGDRLPPSGDPGSPSPPPGPPPDRQTAERPPPTLASLGSAVGGILVLVGLGYLLSAQDVADSRLAIVALSLVFVVIGALITWAARSARAAAGGVAISALAAVPLFQALFRDPGDVTAAFTDPGAYRTTQIATLGCLAVVWLGSYLFGPGRRYGLFLGAGVLALWLIPMTWFSLSATERALAPLTQLSSLSSDPFGSGTAGTTPPPSDPTASLDSLLGGGGNGHLDLKLGLTSLVFGVGLLAAAGLIDRRGDARMATPLFATAAITATQAVGYLEKDLRVGGSSMIALMFGIAGIWLGAAGGRRFTAWLGVLAVAMSTARLVDAVLDSKATSVGALLSIGGLIVVLGCIALERSGAQPFGGRPVTEPGGPEPDPGSHRTSPG